MGECILVQNFETPKKGATHASNTRRSPGVGGRAMAEGAAACACMYMVNQNRIPNYIAQPLGTCTGRYTSGKMDSFFPQYEGEGIRDWRVEWLSCSSLPTIPQQY